MNPKQGIFEISYMAGLAHYSSAYDESLSQSERQENLLSAVGRFEEALSEGLARDQEEEFDCRTRLGIALVQLNYKNNGEISQNGLSNGLARAVEHLEHALKIDANDEGSFLRDRRVAATVLLQLDTLWLAESSHQYKLYGAISALKYVSSKVKLLEHLGGIYLPGVCAVLFQYWTETGSPGIGEEWLRRAAQAETFDDVASGTFFCSTSSQYKNSARQMLNQLNA